ncbi:jg1701 [Pararge aegeria aegeria]|uniref:Jg1701 protein n=1 Tax=Pararge aegeria aegeria TaxID=348720 RepID=A0A8S4SN54_9NEOP|nr:jg1701 [Pararge aegeria aegeria]
MKIDVIQFPPSHLNKSTQRSQLRPLTFFRAAILCVTDSPLCRACMEKNETPTHVMLECTGVTEQREISQKSSATWAACWDSGTSLDGWSSEQHCEISRTTSEALTCGNCPEEEEEEENAFVNCWESY